MLESDMQASGGKKMISSSYPAVTQTSVAMLHASCAYWCNSVMIVMVSTNHNLW